MTQCHPSHNTEYRDSSHYEELCLNCGQTDTPGGWGRLAEPCPVYSGWSKLVDTSAGQHVLDNMKKNPHLRYHTPTHVRSLYAHASELKIPYNVNLDAAILFHDAIYDDKPEKELRSAEFMRDTISNDSTWPGDIDIDVVYDMIMNTFGHKITHGVDPAMIMLDLRDLLTLDKTCANFELIIEESMLLYNITRKQAAQGSYDFMVGFKDTIITNMSHSEESALFWCGVLTGVIVTINMSLDTINS